MSKPESIDVSEAPERHNASSQQRVLENDDPALDKSHEHNHRHIHHDQHAEQGRKEEVVYSKGTTFEKSAIPHQDPQDHDLARRRHADPSRASNGTQDMEKAAISPDRLDEQDPRTHTLSNVYTRYRIFFHLFIWLFFTGYVVCGQEKSKESPYSDYIIDGGLQVSCFTGMILCHHEQDG